MNDEPLRRPVLYRVPGMDEVGPPRRLTYKRAAETGLAMDVYTPPGLADDTRAPAVIFIHGGPLPASLPLLPTEWGVFVSYGQIVAASGFAGVTFNHRYANPAELEQSAGDVNSAIEYVRTHAEELRIDPDRLCLWAFSGGGPQLSPTLSDRPSYVRCIVAYYALLDLRHFDHQGSAGIEAVRTRFSPAAYLKQNAGTVPPLFVARAGLDPDINVSIDRFASEALAANVPLDLVNHPRGHHAFDILDDDARTHEILARTIEFVRVHLTPATEE